MIIFIVFYAISQQIDKDFSQCTKKPRKKGRHEASLKSRNLSIKTSSGSPSPFPLIPSDQQSIPDPVPEANLPGGTKAA